jgi:hypothetical protein
MTLPGHHATDTDCDNCGASIDISHWYPIETVVREDGVELHRFCTRACRDDWTDGP